MKPNQTKGRKGHKVPKDHKDTRVKVQSETALKCIDWSDDGRGIIQFQGKMLPVAGLIPDEIAEIRIKRGLAGLPTEGIVERLVTPSPHRVKPECRHYGPCGACQLQHLSAEGQRSFKQTVANRYLSEFAKVEPILSMEKPWHYRNKSHLTFSSNGPGRISSGLYQEGSHRVVPIENCLVQPENVDAIASTLRTLIKSFRYEAYNEDTQRGLIRHLLVRQGFSTGEVMVVIVVSKFQVPSKRNFLQALLKAHPNIKTVLLNINSSRTSMVLGTQFERLYGPGYIREVTNNLVFEIFPSSFYQINPYQTEQLYRIAIEGAGLTGSEVVVDAYCGVGTLGLFASSKAKYVYGVESNRDSVEFAQKNAKINGISNIKFVAADAGQWMQQQSSQGLKIDVLIMDPPRSGADQAFLSSVVQIQPKRIAYVSCNVETQARDLKFLVQHGYKVVKIQPVDMFPQSFHIEGVCHLEWINKP